ncbi:Uncharacterised protein [Mycobacterium tuberculosis]|nr:Uncharacterised protein [Mycobacterium tuberculosis]
MLFSLRFSLLLLPSFHIPLSRFKVSPRDNGRVGVLNNYLLLFRQFFAAFNCNTCCRLPALHQIADIMRIAQNNFYG